MQPRKQLILLLYKAKNTLLFFLLLVAVPEQVHAQKQKTHQHLVWYRYDLQAKLGDHLKGQFEIENRQYWFPWKQHQFLIRSSIDRNLGFSSAVGAGFCYFLQATPQDPNIKQYVDHIELRPHIWLKHKDELNKNIALKHRLMNEFRFFEDGNGGFDYSNIRLRYQLSIAYKVSEKIKLSAFDEIHMNLANDIVLNTFDQNRLGVGLTYVQNKNLAVELNYFKWYQQLNTGVDFVLRDIIRLTVHHRL